MLVKGLQLFDQPPFLFSIRRFLMKPLTGEYQLLEAKT